MAKNNYNKMYESNNKKKIKDTTSIDPVEPINLVDQAAQNDIELVDPVTTEPEQPISPVIEKTEPEPETRKAVVYNCVKLNVRENPDPNAKVLMTINAGEEITIYGSDYSGNYYSVCTETGVEGYCVKDYLKMN